MSTAQHSTAQHSTAQHSTAQHSTAQHVDYLSQRLFVKQFAQNLLTFKGLVDSFYMPSFLNGGVELA